MKILILNNHLDIGGITRYVLNLSSGLKKRGHSVFVGSSFIRGLLFVVVLKSSFNSSVSFPKSIMIVSMVNSVDKPSP